MREMIKMVVVLTVLCAFSGGLLAALRDATKERIEIQQLEFVKGPAIRKILEGASNDPIKDRFKIKVGETERTFFVGVFDGKPTTVAYEASGKGFGGEIRMMVGVNLEDDKIAGVGVTTHSETPGIGARAQTDPKFAGQFKGLSFTEELKIKGDGGKIDAMSGATVTSKGVTAAVNDAGKFYKEIKPQIAEQVKSFQK